jgi:hypothetical protein
MVAEPEIPAVNALPLSFFTPGDVMGTPVHATYYGGPRDAWRKIVDVYGVERGCLVVERSVHLRSPTCASI